MLRDEPSSRPPPKILVLQLYYERPRLLRQALRSVVVAGLQYPHWTLTLCDDGSPTPGQPIVEEELRDYPGQFHCLRTKPQCATPEWKSKRGSMVGRLINRAIMRSDADVGILLCDDDGIHPDYFWRLGDFFQQRPNTLSCYSQVIIYDPLNETIAACQTPEEEIRRSTAANLNRHTGPLATWCQVDASQVAWRLSCNKVHGAWFPENCNSCQDAFFFDELYRHCGLTARTGFFCQYKGWHPRQLGQLGPEEAWRQRIDRDEEVEG